MVNQGQEDEYIQVQGSYSYIDTKGRLVNVVYRADKDGYHLIEKEMGVSKSLYYILLNIFVMYTINKKKYATYAMLTELP